MPASTPEKMFLEKMRPMLQQHEESLSKMPNPMTIYLAEVGVVMILQTIYPSLLRTFLFRLSLLPILLTTTVLYFAWSLNEMLRSSTELRALEMKETELEKRHAAIDKNTQDVSRLQTKIQNLITECDKYSTTGAIKQ